MNAKAIASVVSQHIFKMPARKKGEKNCFGLCKLVILAE